MSLIMRRGWALSVAMVAGLVFWLCMDLIANPPPHPIGIAGSGVETVNDSTYLSYRTWRMSDGSTKRAWTFYWKCRSTDCLSLVGSTEHFGDLNPGARHEYLRRVKEIQFLGTKLPQ